MHSYKKYNITGINSKSYALIILKVLCMRREIRKVNSKRIQNINKTL